MRLVLFLLIRQRLQPLVVLFECLLVVEAAGDRINAAISVSLQFSSTSSPLLQSTITLVLVAGVVRLVLIARLFFAIAHHQTARRQKTACVACNLLAFYDKLNRIKLTVTDELNQLVDILVAYHVQQLSSCVSCTIVNTSQQTHKTRSCRAAEFRPIFRVLSV